MPEVLDNCVQGLMKKGYSRSRVYAICVKSTGWKKAKGGGWTKREKGSKHSAGLGKFIEDRKKL